MKERGHILVTGGAGYIGSLLVGTLLERGDHVTVVDTLLFGGESLLAYLHSPGFHFKRADICERDVLQQAAGEAMGKGAGPVSAVVHLAALVGFPACQEVGKEAVWRTNVEGLRRTFEAVEELKADRLLFSSTYSVYGLTPEGEKVTEESTLNPQSTYAESKIAGEQFLREVAGSAHCAPLIFRFATLYGISPRPRFDLIVNQFVLEAYTRGELLIFQGDYSRSFVHIKDVVAGLLLGLQAPQEDIRGEVFNLGSTAGNHTKNEIVAMIQQALPEVRVRREALSFGGDMRDVSVSFDKIEETLGFHAKGSVREGIDEILGVLRCGLLSDPLSPVYRNAEPIVQ